MKKNIFIFSLLVIGLFFSLKTEVMTETEIPIINTQGYREQEDQTGETLNIYNWYNFFPNSLYEKFEKKYNVKIIERTYQVSEEMVEKLTFPNKFDIVFASSGTASILIEKKLVATIDKSKISTMENIEPIILEMSRVFDKNLEYTVPFDAGFTGIMINKKLTKVEVKDYSIYERKDLKGKMALFDSKLEIVAAATSMLGFKQGTQKDREIAQIGKLIKKWVDNVDFDSARFGEKVLNGEKAVAQIYPDDYKDLIEKTKNSDVELIKPKKGGVAYIVPMMMLKNSKKKDLVYKFFEFIHEPENYKEIFEFIGVACIDKEACKVTEVKPMISLEELWRMDLIVDYGAADEKYEKMWSNILENK